MKSSRFGRLATRLARNLCLVLLLVTSVESFVVTWNPSNLQGIHRLSSITRLPASLPVDNNEGKETILDSSLLRLLRPPGNCRVDQMSPTDLAYVGDAVYELLVRSRMVWPSKRTSHLQTQVVDLVRAEHQSTLLAKLRQEFDLTAAEQQILSRGRNSSTNSSKNRRNPVAYQDSTALEALIGFLFITDDLRCHELLQWIHANLQQEGNNEPATSSTTL